MTLYIFEKILNNPEMMRAYDNDPVKKACFMAFYEYIKSGEKLSQLACFNGTNIEIIERLINEKIA